MVLVPCPVKFVQPSGIDQTYDEAPMKFTLYVATVPVGAVLLQTSTGPLIPLNGIANLLNVKNDNSKNSRNKIIGESDVYNRIINTQTIWMSDDS